MNPGVSHGVPTIRGMPLRVKDVLEEFSALDSSARMSHVVASDLRTDTNV